MALKRPVDVLVLDSDSEDERSTPRSAPSRSNTASRGPGAPQSTSLDDDEDSELARAIALSLREAESSKAVSTPASFQSRIPDKVITDRAELERARLERQRQREAQGGSALQTVKVASTSRVGTKRPRVATLADVRDPSPPSTSSQAFASTSSAASKHAQRFWSGSVKRVANSYVPDADSFTFRDLIGSPSTLKAAVVSAFCLDPHWVVSHFQDETPLLLVMPRPRGDASPALAVCSIKENTYRAIPDEKTADAWQGVMHTKLLIYYHDDYCRIVIPTANAVPYDWDLIDNAFYVHDFPYSPSDEADPFKNPTHCQFSRAFFQVCYTLNVPKRFIADSRDYDFSSAKDVRLVHSTQGRFVPKDQWNKGGGMASLANAVKAFNFAPGGKWEIEATGSSIGSYYPAWLSQMLGACSGIHPASYFRSGRNNTVPPGSPAPAVGQPVNLPIKIVFPTETEITGSFGGAPGGGTLFCPVKRWEEPNFPRHLFHRGESKRSRVAAHTKIILALHKFDRGSLVPPKHEGWMYLGSHNFTPAAWGKLQNGSNGPQIVLNNYELGVVLPIRADSAEELERKASELVTYRRPLQRYSPDERPWQQERFLSTD
ncbi:hypothetical protein Rhopal_000794-T1 [Rhodotorula paludigena]|uniref:Tyrosyl-DNA phosphodiesterase 1 n=1 Tax=Rhodotorula paludigena TaxID=86838 RepID=A0AAV5GD93_9BASI|nr:hypothetical protein Rhopal_000794-T1 [Rhodotorula paludigena]